MEQEQFNATEEQSVVIEKTKIKYEITEDLRLHVWYSESDTVTEPPFYYQNVHPSGTEWTSREEVEQYFLEKFTNNLFEIV
jgi:GMP synthase-like glutamine amidotransferase